MKNKIDENLPHVTRGNHNYGLYISVIGGSVVIALSVIYIIMLLI